MSAVVDFPVKPEARPYLEAFGRGAFAGDRHEPDWLAAYRKASLARFAELGFPSRRGEAWRYIDLRTLEVSKVVDVPQSPQEVLIRPDGRVAYVSCSQKRQVAAIDLKDWGVQLIEAGPDADGLAWANTSSAPASAERSSKPAESRGPGF